MPRINFYEPFVFMAHCVSFTVTPVNSERFKAEYEDRKRKSSKNFRVSSGNYLEVRDEIDRYNKSELDFWWIFTHPTDAMKMFKEYHMTSYKAMFFYAIHTLICLHLTVKSILHSFLTGADQEKIKYFDSLYYPYLAGASYEPIFLNNVFLAISLSALIFRLRCAFLVMRNALINSDHYDDIQISQVNFSSITASSLYLSEWFSFWKNAGKHNRIVDQNPKLREKYTKFKLKLKQIERLPLIDSMYYINLFDYEEHYEQFDRLGYFQDENRPQRYKLWHCAQHYARVSTNIARFALITLLLCMIILLITVTVSVFGMTYLELRSSYPRYYQVSILEVFSNWRKHFSNFSHIVRFFELIVLVFIQIPTQFDAAVVFFDSTILILKTRRLIDNYRYDFDYCRLQSHIRNIYIHLNQSNRLSEDNPETPIHISYRGSIVNKATNKESKELNIRIRYLTQLSALVYLEFLNIKKAHTNYLNLLVIVCFVSLSYSLSLILILRSTAELTILAAIVVFLLVPMTSILVFCAAVERSVSYEALYRLKANFIVQSFNIKLTVHLNIFHSLRIYIK